MYKTNPWIIFNRPLTPHLTIYSSQLTSLYSIWHRITGLILIFVLIGFLISLKFSIYFPIKFKFQIVFFYYLWLVNTLFLILNIFLIYHMLNGIRHIIWDLGYNLSIKKVIKSAKFISIILIIYSLVIVNKIIN